MELDPWQIEVLGTEGNIVLRSGRQVGKSTVVSIKAGEFACNNAKKTILVIASVERQAYLLFEKILSYIDAKYKKMIKLGKDRPTKSRIRLKNGSVIYCLPTGLTGHGIRGYTVDLLIADEAAFIPEEVWTAVTPMLAVTKGEIILLSTPFGKQGYFFNCFSDPAYTSFHVTSEECPRIPKAFLDHERSRMTRLQYAQEYLGEFVDELRQFFPTRLIEQCCKTKPTNTSRESPLFRKFLGIDVARMGGDETVLFSLGLKNDHFHELDLNITKDTYLTDTFDLIKRYNREMNYKKIFIDDGGLGVGVFDMLLKDPETKRKVEAINNSSRPLDLDKRRKKILKEDLYNNLLTLMEQGRMHLNYDERTIMSLKSIQIDYTDDGRIKIFGRYTHITEALIRAAWGIHSKSLNMYLYYS